ncbi:MAG: tape measure protein, partial [Xanthomonadales bacterium]|nr:tape measure protein [Xanthomonadales bacterium]
MTQVKDAVENLGRDGSRAMGDLQEGAENAAKGVEEVDQQAKELQSTPLDDKLHAAVMAMKALAAEQENLSRRRLLPEGVATEAERIGMAIETVQERLDELRTQPVDTPIDPSASEQVQQLEQQLGRLQGEMSDLDANTRAVSNTTSGLGRTFGEVEDELRKQIRAVEESTVEFQRGRVGLAQYQLEQAGLENATQDTQDRLRGLVRTLEQVEDANNEARQATQEHTTDLDRLRNVAVLAFAAFGVRELLDYGRAALSTAEDARGLEARLNLLNSATVKQGQAFQNVVDIAVATGANLNATGNLYQRIGQATQTLNVSQQQIINTVKGLNTLLAVSNTTGEEAASVITQYAQAVGEGRLRAEEFNAILSAAPGFAQLLADSLGVSVDALRTLSEQGRITGLDLINVFQGDNAKALEAQFSKLPLNVSRELQKLSSIVTVELAKIDETLSVNVGIAGFIASLSDASEGASDVLVPAIENITTAATILAAVLTSRLIVSLSGSAAEFVRSGGVARAFGLQAEFAALRTGQLTRAQVALTAAQRVGQGALALLGGPVGLALVVAQLGAYAFLSRDAAASTEELENRVRRLTDASQEATSAQLSETIAQVESRLKTIREQQAQLADRGIFPPALGESVQRLEMQLAQLQQRLVDVDANNKNAGKSASGLSKTFVELEGDIRKQIKSLTEQTIELERGTVGLVEYQLEQAGLGNASEKTRERFEALVRALRNATKASDD